MIQFIETLFTLSLLWHNTLMTFLHELALTDVMHILRRHPLLYPTLNPYYVIYLNTNHFRRLTHIAHARHS